MPPLSRARLVRDAALLLALVVLATLLALAYGPEGSRLREALFGGPEAALDRTIVFSVRLPRILLGLSVGAALGAAGAALQALLRNPLADPYVLGLSGGAALGGALAIALGSLLGTAGLSLGALSDALPPLASFLGAA